MPGAAGVIDELRRDYSIIYLTHRPDIFTQESKRWLRKHDYPVGPLLTSTLEEFFKGSGPYKSAAIENIKRMFPAVDVGIGDKTSDAQAYLDNGMKAILVIHPDDMTTPEEVRRWTGDLKALPEEVEVVDTWLMVERILFESGRYPPSLAVERLEALAREREAEASGASAPAVGAEEGGGQ